MNETAPAKRRGRPAKVRPVTITAVEITREWPGVGLRPNPDMARYFAIALERLAERAADVGEYDVVKRAREALDGIARGLAAGGVQLIGAQENAFAIIELGNRQLGRAYASEERRSGGRFEAKSLDLWKEAATDFLRLNTTQRGVKMNDIRSGRDADKSITAINYGLDVLECCGEELDAVAAERARRKDRSSPWTLSPWDRDPVGLNDRERDWFRRLRRQFPDKFPASAAAILRT